MDNKLNSDLNAYKKSLSVSEVIKEAQDYLKKKH
jgi:hypothetical protein